VPTASLTPIGLPKSRETIISVQPNVHRNGATLTASSLDASRLSLDAIASAPSPSEALSRLSPDALAALSGRCATIQSAIQLAIITRTAAPIDHANGNGSVRMIDADTAAAVLGKPRRWLFDNARRLPFVRRISRKTLLCDEAGLNRWLQSRPR